MSIGGENRFGRLSVSALDRFVRNSGIEKLGFDSTWCLEEIARLGGLIPGALRGVFEESESIPGCPELQSHLEQPIVENCRTILAQLGR